MTTVKIRGMGLVGAAALALAPGAAAEAPPRPEQTAPDAATPAPTTQTPRKPAEARHPIALSDIPPPESACGESEKEKGACSPKPETPAPEGSTPR